MEFKDVFDKLITAHGYTYRELAIHLNARYEPKFSKSTLQSWREGNSYPSIHHANALADFFDVSLDELAGRKELPEKALKNNSSDVIAAHIEDDVTDEEMKEILNFIDYIKQKEK